MSFLLFGAGGRTNRWSVAISASCFALIVAVPSPHFCMLLFPKQRHASPRKSSKAQDAGGFPIFATAKCPRQRMLVCDTSG